jgi:hypothetical protein
MLQQNENLPSQKLRPTSRKMAPFFRGALSSGIAAVLLCSCGPKVNTAPYSFDEPLQPITKWDDSTAQSASAAETSPSSSLPKLREGTLQRTDVNAVLDAGPGALLRELDLQAVLQGNTFIGWEIVSIVSASSPAARADLIPNDVIRTINQQAVGKPDELMAVWNSLRTAPRLDVEMTRAGKPYMLSFAIVDAAAAPPTNPR